jgi:hypothetical protein
MIGTIQNTICIHGFLHMDCQVCTDNEEFDTDSDDENGKPKWFLDLEDLPVCNNITASTPVQIDEISGIDAIIADELRADHGF